MISALISLVVSLAVLYVVYLILQWIFGLIGVVPPIATRIMYIIFAVLAFIIILNFIGAMFGGSFGFPLIR